MTSFEKKLYIAAGFTTHFVGSRREDDLPAQSQKNFDDFLLETAQGTLAQVPNPNFDEGVIGSFMSGKFLNQANLPGFLPFMVPSLQGKYCVAVEGACGTGGRVISTGVRSLLSGLADSVFGAAFEMQNTVKAVYGADALAGAAFYRKERKSGHAFFFPGIFAERAGAYYRVYGEEKTRQALAKWFEQAIQNARKNPKAQEYDNKIENLYEAGLTPPNPQKFVPYLNYYDCSKVSDGAASLVILTEKGLADTGIAKEKAIEIIGIGESQGDITRDPEDLTVLGNSVLAVQKALDQAHLKIDDIGIMEVHDCFTISGLLSIEAAGLAEPGKGPEFILEGNIAPDGKFPTNLSGGLCGFGHPTGATGVRQMVDLFLQLTGQAPNQAKLRTPYGMMISMGGNDKTVTCVIVKAPE